MLSWDTKSLQTSSGYFVSDFQDVLIILRGMCRWNQLKPNVEAFTPWKIDKQQGGVKDDGVIPTQREFVTLSMESVEASSARLSKYTVGPPNAASRSNIQKRNAKK